MKRDYRRRAAASIRYCVPGINRPACSTALSRAAAKCAASIGSSELAIVDAGAAETTARPQRVVGDDPGQGPTQPCVEALGIAARGVENQQRLAGPAGFSLGGAHQRGPDTMAARASVHQHLGDVGAMGLVLG